MARGDLFLNGGFVTILYITQNGITDHIGRSQIAPYLIGLARRGFRLRVLSAEKPGREELIGRYQQLFDEVGLRWTRLSYQNTMPPLGQALTQLRMEYVARSIVKRERIRVVHCRSFLPALIGRALKRNFGVRFVFDFRDFSADGGLVKDTGVKKMINAWLKRLEGPMIQEADKIVCLTRKARELLSEWYLQTDPYAESRFQIVPCCADFTHFDVARLTPAEIESARAKVGLRNGHPVLLYLGSLGPDYLLPQMMALFAQLLKARPDSQFLFVCNNGLELVEAESVAHSLPRDRIVFTSADRDEIPALIALADMSVIFIRADVSKAGCSPTKLAELFACGIPVIANSGVGDLDDILVPERNGSVVVPDFSDVSLRGAIEQVLSFRQSKSIDIREHSREFNLDEGVKRYAAIYSEMLSR
jgi:glycosyltransferase involved in cell wall biosynthesis